MRIHLNKLFASFLKKRKKPSMVDVLKESDTQDPDYSNPIQNQVVYENDLKFEQKYLEGIKDFGLNIETLKHFGGCPFGGFIRDIYHNQRPRDLDLLFFNKQAYQDFLLLLRVEGWNTEMVSRKENYSLEQEVTFCQKKIAGEVKEIDIMFANGLVSLKYLDFYANAFALNLNTETFFYWNSSFHYKPLEFLKQKITFLNYLYISADNYFAQERILKKLTQFKQNGWEINYTSLIANLPKNIVQLIIEEWPNELKKTFVVKYLTSESAQIREVAAFYWNLLESNQEIPTCLLAQLFKRI